VRAGNGEGIPRKAQRATPVAEGCYEVVSLADGRKEILFLVESLAYNENITLSDVPEVSYYIYV
jgi:hypothetical protein